MALARSLYASQVVPQIASILTRLAFAFALSRSARRGRPLKAGDLIATGNATGIHDILPGQQARIEFHGHGSIEALAVAASPKDEGDWRA